MSIKPTFSLDVESMRALEELAKRWNVSKSEALRRAIRIAANDDVPTRSAALDALDRLQSSLTDRKVDIARWAAEPQAEHYATT